MSLKQQLRAEKTHLEAEMSLKQQLRAEKTHLEAEMSLKQLSGLRGWRGWMEKTDDDGVMG